MIGLERAIRGDADISGLLVAQFCQLDAELRQMQHRDHFIQMLGQGVDLVFIFLAALPELDLGQHLIGE